jgi:hypothetical protein
MERRSRRRKRFSRGGEGPPPEFDAAQAGAPELWSFSAHPGLGSIDLLGWSVEAIDGLIGEVEQASYEWRHSYLIVRAAAGTRLLLPAGVVDRLDRDSQTVFVARSREEVEGAPDYDEGQSAPDDHQRAALSHYYVAYRE